jgi:hypothetical protein
MKRTIAFARDGAFKSPALHRDMSARYDISNLITHHAMNGASASLREEEAG